MQVLRMHSQEKSEEEKEEIGFGHFLRINEGKAPTLMEFKAKAGNRAAAEAAEENRSPEPIRMAHQLCK